MVARINLLPWREERRQERQKRFLITLVAVFASAALLVLFIEFSIGSSIEEQRGRNNYLQTQINQLNKQVKEIKDLEKKRRELLDRMQIIQDLQGTRPLIVRVFDEQVRSLPDGVFFESLTRKEERIDVKGVAESNNRVSGLMRNLEESTWFANPALSAVNAAPRFGEQASRFDLSFSIESQDTLDKEEK